MFSTFFFTDFDVISIITAVDFFLFSFFLIFKASVVTEVRGRVCE